MLQRCIQIAAIVWFTAAAVLLGMSLFSENQSYSPGLVPELYFCAIVILSPVTWTLFGWDKWKARREGSRIPEKTLHMLAFFGGWPGAVLGQTVFRHKTVKPKFRLILGLIVAVHVCIGLSALYLGYVAE